MRFELVIDGEAHSVEIGMGKLVTVKIGDETFQAEAKKSDEGMIIHLDGRKYKVVLESSHISIDGQGHEVEVRKLRRGRPSWHRATASPEDVAKRKPLEKITPGKEMIYPPMPGSVVAIKVKEGDVVEAGSSILVLEAMKMQNEIHSSRDGVVREIRVSEGDLVGPGDVLMVIGD